MKILIDNGHGMNTGVNCSPDKRLIEYAYTREIARVLEARLKKSGYDAERIVTEDFDVSLGERCRRANIICDKHGAGNVILISIHVDAAGLGKSWMKAGGWSAYTSIGKTKADTFAECLYDAAKVHLSRYASIMEDGKKKGAYGKEQKPFRTDKSDGDSDKESNFYILSHTRCPAVLTENLFQDNPSDVDYLLSEDGKKAIVSLHFDGIVNYIKKSRL